MTDTPTSSAEMHLQRAHDLYRKAQYAALAGKEREATQYEREARAAEEAARQVGVSAAAPEQPYGPGAICAECGHFAERHDPEGCHFPRPADNPCRCAGMLWIGVRWPRPWLPAPRGLVVTDG